MGFGEPPRHRDAGGLLPHLFTLTTGISGETLCRWRSPFCATFRRLSPPRLREHPALRCPDFPRRSGAPRSPGLRVEFYLCQGLLAPDLAAAFGAEHDAGTRVHDELAADEALQRS